MLGQKREYLTIKILHNDMTVQVPCENADQVGLRAGHRREGSRRWCSKALTGGSTEMPKNWNRRFKHNRDKMKTGDILELAEVVRNLSLRDHEKGLSTGEKQMFVKAKKILASELMYAKDMDEDECAEWLDDVLAGVGGNGKKQPTAEEEGRRRDRASRRSCSVWAILVAAGRGERLGLDQPKAFAKLGERPAARRAAAPARGVRLDRRDRRRRAAGLGGAGDPARRGARLRQGAARASPAARRGPTRCGPGSPRCRPTPSRCSCTTRRGRSSPTR